MNGMMPPSTGRLNEAAPEIFQARAPRAPRDALPGWTRATQGPGEGNAPRDPRAPRAEIPSPGGRLSQGVLPPTRIYVEKRIS